MLLGNIKIILLIERKEIFIKITFSEVNHIYCQNKNNQGNKYKNLKSLIKN